MRALLESLIAHQVMSREESRSVLTEIADGAYSDYEVAAFMMALTMRKLSVAELEGFREALLECCEGVNLGGVPAIDMCGTGGDGKDTFNISTLAAMVVAGAGVPVVKHGNYGVSSRCGASNVLEALGVVMPRTQSEVLRDLERAGAAFLHAPHFHPAMKRVAPIRKALRFRTFFNLLGPLVNPARPPFQMNGVMNLELLRLYTYLLQRTPVRQFAVVHSLEGYDEISLTGMVKVAMRDELRMWSPEDMGYQRHLGDALHGGDSIAASAALFIEILRGEGTTAQQEVVLANASLGLRCALGVSSLESRERARESLQSGRALAVLTTLTEG